MEEVKAVIYGLFMMGIIIIMFLFFNQKIIQILKSKTNTVINKLKNIWIRILNRLSALLRIGSNKIENRINDSSFIQDSLSPKLLTDEELNRINPYIKRIVDGVRNPDITNIALMGSYGSGKSTIIKNFEFLYPNYKVLNLSLGSYSKQELENQDANAEEIDNIDDLNEKLENSLVKQMIYREKNSKLPYSRFKKINHISSRKKFLLYFLFLASLISFFYLKDYLNFKEIILSNVEGIASKTESLDLILYCVLLASISILFFQVFQTVLKQFKLSKLNFANVSIEEDKNNFSYFNKYIDEILYYFETNKFDVVVIEDVDRFKSIRVFEHLKELNLLLNNSKQINRKITFVYAVKEDIFSNSKEEIEEHESEIRTKFFELIIPIIPVVDTFNSREYLVPMMKEKSDGKLSGRFKNFLKDISLYISDLRLLTNIVNEFFTYLDIHGSLSGSMNKEALFSIIALKNLVPSAFTELQKSQGFIYEIIVQGKFDDELIKEVNEELTIIEAEFKKIEEQINVDKLSEIKKFLFDQGISIIDGILLDGKYRNLEDLDMTIIDSILENHEENINFNLWKRGVFNISKSRFKQILQEQDSILIVRREKKQEEYDLKRDELNNFSRASLKQKLKMYPNLVGLIYVEMTKGKYDNKDKDFILYILSNGYLAEDYSTYLSIFYERSMTIDDKNLLVKLKSNQSVEFNEKLDNPEGFVSELLPQDFEKQGVLNINILKYLFSNSFKDQHKIREAVLEKIFIQEEAIYLENLKIILAEDKLNISNLVFELLRKYSNDFIEKCNASEKTRLIDLIFYACLGDITLYYGKDSRKNQLLQVLSKYKSVYEGNEDAADYAFLIRDNILNRPNFFIEIEEYVEPSTMMEVLSEHNEEAIESAKIYFNEIELDNLSKEQYNKFIQYDLYRYDKDMFSKILNYKNSDELKAVSYANILNSKIDNLIRNTNMNLYHFVDEVLFSLNELSETEGSFLSLLNSPKLNKPDIKTNLIDKSNVTIEKIKQVTDSSLWATLLEKRKCSITWENIEDYYENVDIDLSVMNSIFTNQNEVTSLKKQYDKSDSKDKLKVLLKRMVDNKAIGITEDNIELLGVTTYDAGNLSSQSTHILARNNLIDFNIENVSKFKEDGVIVEVVLNHPNDFLENYSEIDLSEEEMFSLIMNWKLESIKELLGTIVNEESDEFFENTRLVEILLERGISSNDTLLVKLFENIDVEYLKEYFIFNLQEMTLSKSTIEQTLNLFLENDITDFSTEEYDCIFNNLSNTELFVDLLNNLFKNKKLNEISIKNVTYWLGTQNKPISELYIDEDGKNKVVEIENTPQNVELLNNLKRIGIVSTFKVMGDSNIKVNMRRKVPEELKIELL
ncbi:YobI family P-loop NTPase [Enterococcus hirae]|uniref:YobI family P-loop NTPase n=1 Tax=Enterococcus hirae TaxID=1354 RepID=UPI003FD66126